MFKKFFAIVFCLIVASFYCSANADGNFTWFGLKKDNTEIVFRSNPNHDRHTAKCHHKKPKHKPKPKHRHTPKDPKHHKCLWWCK